MTTVARVTSPADLAASVPEVLGYVPSESLVVLSLREPRGRLGMTMRFDLAAAHVLADEVGPRLVQDGATRAALLLHTDEPGPLPRGELVHRIAADVEARGIRVTEALLVRDGTWWSYLCQLPCCPPEGAPVGAPGTGGTGLLAAERVLEGKVVYGSREELAATLLPVLPLGEQVRLDELAAVAQDLLDEVVADRSATVAAEVARSRAALARGGDPGPAQAARLAVALRLPEVRDAMTACVPRQAREVQALMTAVARRTPRSQAGRVLQVLGTAAYAQGEGALARIALEGAVEADGPDTFAGTLLEALDRQVPPSALRDSLRLSARASRAGG